MTATDVVFTGRPRTCLPTSNARNSSKRVVRFIVITVMSTNLCPCSKTARPLHSTNINRTRVVSQFLDFNGTHSAVCTIMSIYVTTIRIIFSNGLQTSRQENINFTFVFPSAATMTFKLDQSLQNLQKRVMRNGRYDQVNIWNTSLKQSLKKEDDDEGTQLYFFPGYLLIYFFRVESQRAAFISLDYGHMSSILCVIMYPQNKKDTDLMKQEREKNTIWILFQVCLFVCLFFHAHGLWPLTFRQVCRNRYEIERFNEGRWPYYYYLFAGCSRILTIT